MSQEARILELIGRKSKLFSADIDIFSDLLIRELMLNFLVRFSRTKLIRVY